MTDFQIFLFLCVLLIVAIVGWAVAHSQVAKYREAEKRQSEYEKSKAAHAAYWGAKVPTPEQVAKSVADERRKAEYQERIFQIKEYRENVRIRLWTSRREEWPRMYNDLFNEWNVLSLTSDDKELVKAKMAAMTAAIVEFRTTMEGTQTPVTIGSLGKEDR